MHIGSAATLKARLPSETQLDFDGKSYTIVGIAPQGFRLEGIELPILTPFGFVRPLPWLKNRARHGLNVWARLRPGATLAQAQAELAAAGRRLAQQYPDSNKGRTFIAGHLEPDVGDARSTLWLLLGAVGLVLLIACANIASLLLARAVSRERELAMRVALGAGRGRLIRQCLTESAVLALGGGCVGRLCLAAFGFRRFVAFWPRRPRCGSDEVQLDWRCRSYLLLVVALGSGLALFGSSARRAGAAH